MSNNNSLVQAVYHDLLSEYDKMLKDKGVQFKAKMQSLKYHTTILQIFRLVKKAFTVKPVKGDQYQ